ncbi:hypothetical protein [Priestia megaterium]|uniref:hypothetical protein n=1 Tax=Priestia megaterium TaxID=1404 RepID=UPI00285D36EB|nr:hypothetical protein [Priestia megaterium]MDR7207655.1 hypothetical protein [Priestia megaterium]
MDLLNKELVANVLYAQYASENHMYWVLSKQYIKTYEKGDYAEALSIKKEIDAVYAKIQAINESRVHLGISDHLWDTVSLNF